MATNKPTSDRKKKTDTTKKKKDTTKKKKNTTKKKKDTSSKKKKKGTSKKKLKEQNKKLKKKNKKLKKKLKKAKSTSPGKSKYTTTEAAQGAVEQLQSSLKDREGENMHTNDLDAYVSDQLRNDYKDFTDYGSILGKYNAQSDASWELARQQQIEAMNRAEAANYANTQNAVSQMRKALVGSASSGANVGAANATALQAMLGLGQQNSETTTEAMQNYQNTAQEAAAARAANAVNALESARTGTTDMYGNATSAYGADHTYGVQGLADAYGNVASNTDTLASQERQNNAGNKTQTSVAKITGKYNVKTAKASK